MSTFRICACTLSGDCHAFAEGEQPCEICDGPAIATAENINKMFKGYEARIAALKGALRDALETLEWVYGCEEPNQEELKASIADSRAALAHDQPKDAMIDAAPPVGEDVVVVEALADIIRATSREHCDGHCRGPQSPCGCAAIAARAILDHLKGEREMKTTDTDAVTLKPCPFCGGRAARLFTDFPEATLHAVGCDDARCFVKTPDFVKEAEAIAAWNRRADNAALAHDQPQEPCPRATSDMTPCYVTDGDEALSGAGACVGCGFQPQEGNP